MFLLHVAHTALLSPDSALRSLVTVSNNIINVYSSLISGTENINQTIIDVRGVYIYENQRWNPMTGYTDK